MATILKRYYYDGGMGTTDRTFVIGYCKEEPIEVLEKLIKTHCIHSYKQIYCTPINEYPANCDGIMILEYNNEGCERYGLMITKSIDDYLNNEWIEKYKWDKFSLDKFLKTIGKTKKYFMHFDENNMYKEIYKNIYKDFSTVYGNILKKSKIQTQSSKTHNPTIDEQAEQFYKILENHKSNGENSYDFLKEWINTYIKELEKIKTEVILRKIYKHNDNKEEIIKEVKKVFEIMNCFEAQKKIYDKFNK